MALMAQWIEHRSSKPMVAGSSPAGGAQTKHTTSRKKSIGQPQGLPLQKIGYPFV